MSSNSRFLTAGMVVADIIAAGLSRFAEPGEMMFLERGIEFHVGGHPANVAIDLVNLGIDGKDIGVVSAVGNDIFGDFLEENLKRRGINSMLMRGRRPTAKNMIFVIQGEDRRFHLDPGANLDLDPDFVRRCVLEFSPDYISCRPGYSGMDTHMHEILSDLRKTTVLLDVCRPYGKEWSYMLPFLEYVNFFHSNLQEASKITGKTDEIKIIDFLLDRGVDAVLITSGGDGALLATDDFIIRQRGFDVDAVDPTGAGDAFCAGILKFCADRDINASSIDEETASEMLVFAQACGAAAASSVGTTPGVTEERVHLILQKKQDIVESQRIERRD